MNFTASYLTFLARVDVANLALGNEIQEMLGFIIKGETNQL